MQRVLQEVLGGLLLLAIPALGRQFALGDQLRPVSAPQLHQPTVVWVAPQASPPSPPPPAFHERAHPDLNAPYGPGQAGSPASLTLEDLERIAIESSPTLVQARMAVQAAQGQYVQAGLWPNPVIGYLVDEIGNDGSEGLQGAFVGQQIVTAGKLRLGRAVAGHQIQQALHGWEIQRRRVLNDVRAGYYDVLVGRKMIDVNEQLVGIGQEGVQVTEQLRAAQEISQAEVLQARIELEQAKLSLYRAGQVHEAAWRRLAALLGRPEMAPAPLAGDAAADLPLLNREDARARLLAQSPELDRARAGIERARCQLALQYAERVPNLEIESAAKYDTGSYYAVADAALGVQLPLFNRNQGNIRSAWAELTSAENELRRIELELSRRFAAAFGPYASSLEHVQTYTHTVLPNAKASLDLVSTGYREGEFGYLALLTAQQTYFRVSLEYLANLKELWDRAVEIEGLLLTGGLEPVE